MIEEMPNNIPVPSIVSMLPSAEYRLHIALSSRAAYLLVAPYNSGHQYRSISSNRSFTGPERNSAVSCKLLQLHRLMFDCYVSYVICKLDHKERIAGCIKLRKCKSAEEEIQVGSKALLKP